MWSRYSLYQRVVAHPAPLLLLVVGRRTRLRTTTGCFSRSPFLRCVSTGENENNESEDNRSEPNDTKKRATKSVLPRFLQQITRRNEEPCQSSSSSHRNSIVNNNRTTEVVDMAVGWHPNRRKKVVARLPKVHALEEFPHPATNKAWRRHQATIRILRMAAQRLGDPPTIHLLAFSFWATLGIAAVEGTILCQASPIIECTEATRFVAWYSIEQLIPSITWATQDPVLVGSVLHTE